MPGELASHLTLVLHREIRKSSLIGEDGYCPGKQPKKGEEALHPARPETEGKCEQAIPHDRNA
jgi:hypothetical protein